MSSREPRRPPPPRSRQATAVSALFNKATRREDPIRPVRDSGIGADHAMSSSDSDSDELVDDSDWMRDDEPEREDAFDPEYDVDADGFATSGSTLSGDEFKEKVSVDAHSPAGGDHSDLLTCGFDFTSSASLSGWEDDGDGAAEDTGVEMANAEQVAPAAEDNVEMADAEDVVPSTDVVIVGVRVWLRRVRSDVGSDRYPGSPGVADGLPEAPASDQKMPDAAARTAGAASTPWRAPAVEDAQDVESAPAEK
jgi:hypothetical protein